MFRNHLLIAWRKLAGNRVFSTVNVLGLSLGLACFFLILLYVRYERSYDQFHPDKDRLYRINYIAKFGEQPLEIARVPAPIGPALTGFFPEIAQAARLFSRSISVRVADSNDEFEIEAALFVDSTLTEVFTLDFPRGEARTALRRPFSVVLSEATAIRLFGSIDAVGKTLRLADQGPFTVTGVVRDFPDNAHLHFDLLAPYDNMVDVEPAHARENVRNMLRNNWLASHSYTYVLLKEEQSAERVNAKFGSFLERFGDPTFRDKQDFALFPVKDIHLRSTAHGEPEAPANPTYLLIFLAIGILTLLIAAINFVNLSTAASLSRAREVGVRKVLGAGRGGLIGQFLGESVLLCSVAFVCSLVLVHFALPQLNTLTDKTIRFSPFTDGRLLLGFAGIALLTGLLAGAYPAFFVSRFRPSLILKGQEPGQAASGVPLRKVLIGVQFLVAIALIGAAFVILQQLEFLRSRPMGFHREQMLTVPLFSSNFNTNFAPGDAGLRQKMNAFEEQLLTQAGVEAVTLSSTYLGNGGVSFPVTTDSITAADNIFLQSLAVDYDFAATYGLHVVAGRDFDRDAGTDHLDAFLINERAVRELGWLSPEAAIGRRITRGGKEGKVVGVLSDFNFASLDNDISPLLLDVSPGLFTYFTIRLRNGELPRTLEHIRSVWQAFFPEKVFEYQFLDDNLQRQYTEETRLSGIIGYFALLAIAISCFGLFGLVTYAIHQKTKEIGIRKVLGATIGHILLLLSSDFIRLIVLAGLVAVPLTYYAMHQWLSDYAYRIDLTWWRLLAPLPVVLFIALLTLSVLTIQAARANPVEALRDE